MPPINLLIKPASGNCNMKCEYCFYCEEMNNRTNPSLGMMSVETLEQVLKKALEQAKDSCTIAFQGGEPTLRGLEFFEKSIALEQTYNIHQVTIQNALQTNGYKLDEKWAAFFAQHHFLVGISIDGKRNSHDFYRKTATGEDTFDEINKTIALLRQYSVDFNILTVVNDKTVKQARKIYEFYRKNGWDYLQFIPCLPPLGNGKKYSPNVSEYGNFLKDLFDCWYVDLRQGKQPYIRQFENYVAILLGNIPDCCDQSGSCQIQYVIEADGSAYPCDFYAMDEYCLGNLKDMEWEEIDRNRKNMKFIENSVSQRENCIGCQYYPVCRGGCTRNFQKNEDSSYQNYFCQSYKIFFDHHYEKLVEIADHIRIQQIIQGYSAT